MREDCRYATRTRRGTRFFGGGLTDPDAFAHAFLTCGSGTPPVALSKDFGKKITVSPRRPCGLCRGRSSGNRWQTPLDGPSWSVSTLAAHFSRFLVSKTKRR